MNILDAEHAISIEILDKFESEISVHLPEEYRNFLVENNGGRPEPNGFIFYRDPEGNRGMIDWFLAIYDGEYDNLEKYIDTYKGRIPINFLPIAHDPGGNLICLSLEGDDMGYVYYWDHDNEVEEGINPDYGNVYPIAKSFNVFLENLREFD